MQKRKFTVRDMAMIGVLAALVFAASLIQMPVVTIAGSNTRLHLGNVMCLLSGILLGPLGGGLAAGIGSAFFDLTNPIYIASAPFTFAFKFAMGFLCGWIAWAQDARGLQWRRNVIAACSGAILYVILYLSKNFISNYFFLRMELATILIDLSTKAMTSCINGVIAAVVSVPLAQAIRRGLSRSGFYRKQH